MLPCEAGGGWKAPPAGLTAQVKEATDERSQSSQEPKGPDVYLEDELPPDPEEAVSVPNVVGDRGPLEMVEDFTAKDHVKHGSRPGTDTVAFARLESDVG